MEETVQNKLCAWKAKLLLQSGRTTLIKAVAQAIPIYTMSTSIFPSQILKEIKRRQRDFWWGNDIKRRNYIQLLGTNFANKSTKEGWVFKKEDR
uniref:Uncharacterized protein n=1 Tax=Nelumbo nucifera TaxID=4432 RepID=A0A822ZLN8_NELNU|nr:TPA_asm: hypothetical protein HUJ06_002671 [Nelumbo nucifera]